MGRPHLPHVRGGDTGCVAPECPVYAEVRQAAFKQAVQLAKGWGARDPRRRVETEAAVAALQQAGSLIDTLPGRVLAFLSTLGCSFGTPGRGGQAGIPPEWAALLLVNGEKRQGRRPTARGRAATLAVSVMFRSFAPLAVAVADMQRGRGVAPAAAAAAAVVEVDRRPVVIGKAGHRQPAAAAVASAVAAAAGKASKVVYVQLAAAQRPSSRRASLVATRVDGLAPRQAAAVEQRQPAVPRADLAALQPVLPVVPPQPWAAGLGPALNGLPGGGQHA